MADPYDLRKLGPTAFEHMVNALALRVLGAGATGFGPGPDGGRDGYFEGVAPYPVDVAVKSRWDGSWYIQSKFHSGESGNGQPWLVQQVQKELAAFSDPQLKRTWPDNWIVATNVDPSGVPETGAFDRIRNMVSKHRNQVRFHIWGGRKILDLLIAHPDVANHYGHFLTPGEVLAALRNALSDATATVDRIVWNLVVTQMVDHQYSKLEQAGGAAGDEPGLHQLFVDLPIETHDLSKWGEWKWRGHAVKTLLETSARVHRASEQRHLTGPAWRQWRNDHRRSGVWFVRGGPGQGKSTIGQYFAQLQRAAIVLLDGSLNTSHQHRSLAEAIRNAACAAELWPDVPRVPIVIELKEFAQWFAEQPAGESRRVITFLAERLRPAVGERVLPGTLRRALAVRSWFVLFDGLDEVPHDVKDAVAAEVTFFLENEIVEIDADVLACCTSRPQGYSGQFAHLECANVVLPLLNRDEALHCATPLLAHKRAQAEAERDVGILGRAMQSDSIRLLMTTPLQSHIMAIVVREGGKPPDRRWQLYNYFYEVIRRREATHELPDPRLTDLLQNKEELLKFVHDRLGFALHARAERSDGAHTQMHKREFETLVRSAVSEVDEMSEDTVDTVMEATTERLVLVNTPDDGDHVRFDIRQLQEFFAGEFIYEDLTEGDLRSRIELLDGDSHWREVIHFILSAVVETRRQMELAVVIDAIADLDEGIDAPTRMLKRRLCRGSLAVLRLLEEGVLEQDARVRQQFRRTLSSAFASTEESVLQMLIAPRLPRSRNWLIDMMVEALEKTRPEEHVGAAVALTALLNDDDPRVPTVVSAMNAAPPAFIALVARCAYELYEHSHDYPAWYLSVLFGLLDGDKWTTLSRDSARAVFTALRWSASSVAVAIDHGWSQMEAELSVWTEPDAEEETESVKVVRLKFMKNDWRRGLPGHVITRYASSTPPSRLFSRILHAAVVFGSAHDAASLRNLVEVVSTLPVGSLEALPEVVAVFIPVDWDGDVRDQLVALRTAGDRELSKLIGQDHFRGRFVPRRAKVQAVGIEYSRRDWDRFVSQYPHAALLTMSNEYWKRHSLKVPTARDEPPVERLVRALLEQPHNFLSAPGLWGKLIALSPKNEKRIRGALLSIADQPVRESGFATECYAFHLKLPQEAALLPHLVAPLMLNHQMNEILAILIELVPDFGDLDRIASDEFCSKPVRLAAGFLCGLRLGEHLGAMLPLLTPEALPWFLPSFTQYVDKFLIEGDPKRSYISAVMHAVRADFNTRELFDSWLQIRREKSFAPITNANVMEMWLKL